MTPKAILDEILQLPLDERLKLVEDVWDSIAVTPEAVPVPDWHRAELDRRLGNASSGPGLSWNDVRAKLHERGQP
jgi:putative addiction module component (TIGR02574 family)